MNRATVGSYGGGGVMCEVPLYFPHPDETEPPWRQPRGKSMASQVNCHTNATRIGWHLWQIDIRFASGLGTWSQSNACHWAAIEKAHRGTSIIRKSPPQRITDRSLGIGLLFIPTGERTLTSEVPLYFSHPDETKVPAASRRPATGPRSRRPISRSFAANPAPCACLFFMVYGLWSMGSSV